MRTDDLFAKLDMYYSVANGRVGNAALKHCLVHFLFTISQYLDPSKSVALDHLLCYPAWHSNLVCWDHCPVRFKI